jgi:hypothetical protein
MNTPEEDTIFKWLFAVAKVALKLFLIYILVISVILILLGVFAWEHNHQHGVYQNGQIGEKVGNV